MTPTQIYRIRQRPGKLQRVGPVEFGELVGKSTSSATRRRTAWSDDPARVWVRGRAPGRWRYSRRLIADVSAEPDAIDSALDAYTSRIAYLRDEATRDGYGLNKRSERDFRQFLRSRPYMRKGDLVLMDNGNLRAIWKDERGGRFGMQFLGGSMAQYVIFRRRRADRAISRVAGRDSLEGVARQIDAFQLHSLLGE